MSGGTDNSSAMQNAAKASQMQQELYSLQTEALAYTRRLRSDIATLFQHAQSGVQQSEQDSNAVMSHRTARDQFLEQVKLNQMSLTKTYSELAKYINSITAKTTAITTQLGAGQNAPHLLLSAKYGDDCQQSAIKIAGSSSPTVYNKYQQMLNSAINWEKVEANSAAIHDALLMSANVVKRRDELKAKFPDPSTIDCKLKDHSKTFSEDGVTFITKAFLEHRIIHVRLEKICNIYLFVKDSQIEKINCIGINEVQDDSNYEADRIHQPSKYKLFQQMGLFIHSYYFLSLRQLYPPVNDDAIFKCLRMLRYYKDFLTEDCAKCGRIMLHGLPPFCIDHSMLEIDKSGMGPEAKIPKYHVECFPHNL